MTPNCTQFHSPTYWATLAYKTHPQWTVEKLVAAAHEQFLTFRYAEILVPHFLRLESLYIALYACPDCIERDGDNFWLECEQCQQDVSNRAWYWLENVFLPRHPAWHAPDAETVRAEVARLREPQMRMEFA